MQRTRLPPLFPLIVLLAGCGRLIPADAGRTIRSGGDLVAFGAAAISTDSVSGDVMMAGGVVDFSGAGEGAFLAAGEEVRILGRISGSTLAAGRAVRFRGTGRRNVLLAGADVRLGAESVVARNAYVAGGQVEHLGTIDGSLRVAGRSVVLNGVVTGDVDLVAGELVLGPLARIGGDLSYRVDSGGVTLDPAAVVEGEVHAVHVPPPSPLPGLIFLFLRLLGFLVVGTVAVLLFRGTLGRWAEGVRSRPLPALGHGLVWLVFVPVLVFVAFVTVLGIPLAVTAALLYAIACYLAPVVPALALGRSLRPAGDGAAAANGRGWEAQAARRREREGMAGRGGEVGSFLIGGTLLGALLLAPWIGWPLRMILTALGFGGVVLAVRDRLAED